MTDARATVAALREGVAAALAVMAAMAVVDLVVVSLQLLATWTDAMPPLAPTRIAVVGGGLVLLGVAVKATLLGLLALRPERLRWLTAGWAVPIALAVLTVASVPLTAWLSVADAVLQLRARDAFLAEGGRGLGARIARTATIETWLQFVAVGSTAVVRAAALLVAVWRLRAWRRAG